MSYWLIRAGEDAFLIDRFINNDLIAIGWELPDLTDINLDDIKELYVKVYPDIAKSKIVKDSNTIHKFLVDFKKGDNVVTYDRKKRVYHVGEIISDYIYDESFYEFKHIKKVNWFKEIKRDDLSKPAQKEMDKQQTLYELKNEAAKEIFTNKEPKIVFLNIGWMKNYQGIRKGDNIESGGSYIAKMGFGHEIFNFQDYHGTYYGYVQAPTINTKRIGKNDNNDSINGVLAVWVGRNPSGGTYIVGWYKNSTIYRKIQYNPKLKRFYKEEQLGYNVQANKEDCYLIPEDKRIFRIPRGKNAMGQANIWYADDDSKIDFKKEVLAYIDDNALPSYIKNKSKKSHGLPRQTDPYKRQKVEKSAIAKTTQYYKNLGYNVESVEGDNLGWDLEATLDKIKLKIEVKGLSQENIMVELTPNEYQKMDQFKEHYRLCVVTNALNNPKLSIFSYDAEKLDDNNLGTWQDGNGLKLEIKPIMSARCYISK